MINTRRHVTANRRTIPARSNAAESMFQAAQLAVERLDEVCWRVAGDYLFWPASGFWRDPHGKPRGGGASALIRDLREKANAAEPPSGGV